MYIVIDEKGYVQDFFSIIPLCDSIKVLDLDPSEMEDFLRYYNYYYFEDGDLLRDDIKIEELNNESRRKQN